MRSQRNLLVGGLWLTLRNWPALVWTYVFNLGLALIFSIPLHLQLSTLTAHSFASQRLATGFDLVRVMEVAGLLRLNQGSAANGSFLTTLAYLMLYFVLVPGTLFCYQTETPARLSTLLQAGILHFWRFVRITLVSFVVFGVVLAGAIMLQRLWAAHVDAHTVGLPALLEELAGVVAIGLVAAALRVYFDLVEVYTVQLGLQLHLVKKKPSSRPEREIRRIFKPTWRTYRRNFFRIYLTFVLLTLLGLSAVVVTALIAMHSLAQPRMWPMFLIAQLGLFLLLFTRFWQRGAESVLALDNPLPEPVVLPAEPVLPEPLVPEPSPGPVTSEESPAA